MGATDARPERLRGRQLSAQQAVPGDELRDLDAFISLPRGHKTPGTHLGGVVAGVAATTAAAQARRACCCPWTSAGFARKLTYLADHCNVASQISASVLRREKNAYRPSGVNRGDPRISRGTAKIRVVAFVRASTM